MLEERVDASEILRLADCLALTSNSVFSRLEASARRPGRTDLDPTLRSRPDPAGRGLVLAWEASPSGGKPGRRQTNGEDPFQAYPFGLPEYFGRADEMTVPNWSTRMEHLGLEGLIQRG